MTRPRKLLAWIVGILAVLEQLVRLLASFLMLLVALLLTWCVGVPCTLYEAYEAIRGPRNDTTR